MNEENATPEKTEEKKERRPTTFGKIIAALQKGPQTREALATIIVENAKGEYTLEQATKTVSTRLNHLKKKGYGIEKTDAGYTLTGEPAS